MPKPTLQKPNITLDALRAFNQRLYDPAQEEEINSGYNEGFVYVNSLVNRVFPDEYGRATNMSANAFDLSRALDRVLGLTRNLEVVLSDWDQANPLQQQVLSANIAFYHREPSREIEFLGGTVSQLTIRKMNTDRFDPENVEAGAENSYDTIGAYLDALKDWLEEVGRYHTREDSKRSEAIQELVTLLQAFENDLRHPIEALVEQHISEGKSRGR